MSEMMTERHFYSTAEDEKILDLLLNYSERGQDRSAILMVLADEFGVSQGSVVGRFNKLKKDRGIKSPRGGYRRSTQQTLEITVSFKEQLTSIADLMDAEIGKKDKKIEALKNEVEEWKEKYYDLEKKLRQATKLAKLLVEED